MSRNKISSIQFCVSTDDIVEIAEILSESELSNCIVSGKSTEDRGDFVLIEVDYDETNNDEMKHIIDITKVITEGRNEEDEEGDDDDEK